MRHFIYSIIAASVAWTCFISALRAGPIASVEIGGVKLVDKDQVTVEAEVRNLSQQYINIDPRIWVQTATLEGQRLSKNPIVMPGKFRVNLTIYADLITLNPNPKPGQPLSWWKVMDWIDDPGDPGRYPPSPLLLRPGETTEISVKIPMTKMLGRDFMNTLSKETWMRVGLNKSGEGDKIYSPEEFARGTLYKLEKPKEGENNIGLEPLKASL